MPRRDHDLDDAEPWLRQPGDTDKSFEAFTVYRDMPPGERRLEEVGRRLGKSGQIISRWSINHEWRARVNAFDRDQDRQYREELDAQRSQVIRKQIRVAGAILGKGVEALNAVDANRMSAGDALRYLLEAMKYEAALYGIGVGDDTPGAQAVSIVIDSRLVTPPTLTAPPLVLEEAVNGEA